MGERTTCHSGLRPGIQHLLINRDTQDRQDNSLAIIAIMDIKIHSRLSGFNGLSRHCRLDSLNPTQPTPTRSVGHSERSEESHTEAVERGNISGIYIFPCNRKHGSHESSEKHEKMRLKETFCVLSTETQKTQNLTENTERATARVSTAIPSS